VNANDLIDAIEDAGYDTMPYAGRGMYGKECVAFLVERGREMAAAARIVGGVADSAARQELVKVFAGANRDNMGRDDNVVYFTRIDHPDGATAETPQSQEVV